MAQFDPRSKPVGRLRAAWLVLLGQRVTPLQIEAEWLEYKLIFEDILTRLGAQLARAARTEKKRVERELVSRPPPTPSSKKAELRSRAAARQGFKPIAPVQVVNGPTLFDDEDEP